jgi:hypothetical protein
VAQTAAMPLRVSVNRLADREVEPGQCFCALPWLPAPVAGTILVLGIGVTALLFVLVVTWALD